MIRLEAMLNNWKAVRQDTAQAVEDMPTTDLDFKATPEMDSFRQIAVHVLNSSNAFIKMALDGAASLADPATREKMKNYFIKLPENADGAAIARELRQSLDARIAELSQQSPEWFAQMITRPDGQSVTRAEMLQGMKEHELTHRSQLFFCLRLKGVVPATTRRRLAKQSAR